uniref:TNFR-Cys domain-containing protein n=1 Tax=Graphocephala atropunctata TaxID=36148 RepID=A0A1B6KZE1_9HEMI
MGSTHHLAFIIVFTTSVSVAIAQVKCGEKVCNISQYCSDGTFCDSCEPVCTRSNVNFDNITCLTRCQDYLRDKLYVKKEDLVGYVRKKDLIGYLGKEDFGDYASKEDLQAAMSRVYVYVVVSLAISILVLILVLGAFSIVWLKFIRTKYQGQRSSKKKMESIKAICVNEVDGPKKLKLQMPVAVPGSEMKDNPPSALTTMTPLSTRHPVEDATLEYAYDNPALTHSPTFNKNTPNTTPNTTRTETSF